MCKHPDIKQIANTACGSNMHLHIISLKKTHLNTHVFLSLKFHVCTCIQSSEAQRSIT